MGPRLRGALFVAAFYALMAAMGVIGAPVVLWRERWCRAWQKAHNRAAFWLLAKICATRVEIRGPVPNGDVVVAAKHQSLLDVLMIYTALPEARFVMKRSLLWAPVFGLYARRTGAVTLDRTAGPGAIGALAAAFQRQRGQIVIYPQGTRVPPGSPPSQHPYRRGALALARKLSRPVVPAATNVGLLWPRRGIARHPGLAVVEFLAPLPRELPLAEAAARLQGVLEAESARLAAETGPPPEADGGPRR